MAAIILTRSVEPLSVNRARIGLTTNISNSANRARLNTSFSTLSYSSYTTKNYPLATNLVYDDGTFTVREANGYTSSGPFLFQNRNFRNITGGWVVDIYMPNGQEVIFDGCTFVSNSQADFIHITNDSRVTIRNCKFYATGTQSIGTTKGRVVYAYQPRKITFENNYLWNTAGAKIEFWTSGASSTDTLTWRYNRYDNICGGTGGDYRQALQLQHIVERPSMDISWNQVINLPGQSRVEDNFNIGESSGTSSSWLHIHNNYVQGAYPANPTDNGFTGTGMTTDAGGLVDATNQPHYIKADKNIWVSTLNAAMNIAAGHDVLYTDNDIITSARLADNTYLPSANNAVAVFKGLGYNDQQFFNNRIEGNRINYVPRAFYDGAGYVGPGSTSLIPGNTFNTYLSTATYADELAAFTMWQNRLQTNQIKVGPL